MYAHLVYRTHIQDIISRGRVPIVVGGTSFYTRFLLTGSTGSPVSTDETRAAVDSLLEEDGGVWEKRYMGKEE